MIFRVDKILNRIILIVNVNKKKEYNIQMWMSEFCLKKIKIKKKRKITECNKQVTNFN